MQLFITLLHAAYRACTSWVTTFAATTVIVLVVVPFFRVLPHLDAVLCARVVVGLAVRPVLVPVRRTVDPLVQVHQV